MQGTAEYKQSFESSAEHHITHTKEAISGLPRKPAMRFKYEDILRAEYQTCMPVIRNERDLLAKHLALVLTENLGVGCWRHNLLAAILEFLPMLMYTSILWQLQLQCCLASSLAQ
jgi:hypothetical protein